MIDNSPQENGVGSISDTDEETTRAGFDHAFVEVSTFFRSRIVHGFYGDKCPLHDRGTARFVGGSWDARRAWISDVLLSRSWYCVNRGGFCFCVPREWSLERGGQPHAASSRPSQLATSQNPYPRLHSPTSVRCASETPQQPEAPRSARVSGPADQGLRGLPDVATQLAKMGDLTVGLGVGPGDGRTARLGQILGVFSSISRGRMSFGYMNSGDLYGGIAITALGAGFALGRSQ